MFTTRVLIAIGVFLPFGVLELGAQGLLSCTASPASVAFGSTTVGASASQTVTVSNNGTGPVTITGVSVTGAGFKVSGISTPLVLLPGQNTNFTVTFTPAAAGNATGTITVGSTATNSPATVSLSGLGVTMLLSITPSSTNFGDVILGSDSVVPVMLTNSGTGAVTISSAAVTGAPFGIGGLTLPLTLQPGQQVSFSATFTPSAPGSFSGSISVVSNATNSPASESLSGIATHAVSLSWQPSSSSNLAGYYVYRSDASGGPYTQLFSSPVASTSYMDVTVQAGHTYYYVATAVDESNGQSTYSNEASAVVPQP